MTHVLMCTEGTYPFGIGGVSTWCEQMVRGTSARFHYTLHAAHHDPRPRPTLPDGVTRLVVARAAPGDACRG
ncbi:DUF3492 domain-containing protein, partial [Deinococcus pimensis]|uniref:DUF3492 domain-containing protein n=1 Tax=Deinococcus pimensis TaxID=309888 RepID=UPI0005EB547D